MNHSTQVRFLLMMELLLLKKQTTEKRDFIKNIRESIEKLFEKEEMISQLFDFQP